jgi:hypothetical protein
LAFGDFLHRVAGPGPAFQCHIQRARPFFGRAPSSPRRSSPPPIAHFPLRAGTCARNVTGRR